ncbi:MAG: hypothetical protein CVV32_01955 [Methanomicrobiales archaeon HGW-Methanomicrobiales-3]|jgi:PAS domain S-box-containing protein|nr:MAG: hypothetical protein CVV32_01955 [Methanomicrobiales archaeon HGW-Methanomicrobiales-3]
MISVLYVDDEPDLCELGQLFLEQSGEMKVDTCTSAKEALASPGFSQYDAVISDYQMPEMDGIEFLQAVRAEHGDLPFILFTGRGREEIVIAAINHGVDFYLQKGGDPTSQFAELAHKIRIAVERRRAKTALKNSEHRFADIINFLPDATFAIDREGKVIAWNRAMEEMTDVPAGEMLGKSDHEYGLPFYGEKRPILIDLVFRDEEEIRTRYPFVERKEDKFISEIYIPRLYGGKGAYLWFIASPLYDSEGEIVGAVESIRDITDRKSAEAALSESEQRLNNIINFLPDATLAVDLEGRVIAWNKAIEEMTNVPAGEMLGKGDHEYALPFYGKRRKIFLDLISNPDDTIAGEYTHLVREKDTLIAETNLTRPKGQSVSLMVKASPLYNRQGEVVGAIESMRDITDLRKAEEDAIHTRKDWETIFRAIGHPAIILNPDNRIIDANDAMVRAAKLPLSDLLGKACYEVFHAPGTTAPPKHCPFEQVKTHPITGTMEEDIEALGGYYHVSCTPVYTADGTLEKVIHIAMDVTEQRRIREELTAALEQMTASQEQLKAQFDELAASEQRIRESEAKYRELADLLPQVVFEMDLDGKITYANGYALTTFGMTGEGLPAGMHALDAIHPSDHGRIRANMEKLARGIPFDDHEYTAVRSDGSPFPVVVYSSPIHKSGRLIGFRGIMADVSILRKAEEALRESEEKYRILFNNVNDAIYLHELLPDGTPGRFIEVNEVMCTRLGYTREELIRLSVRDIVSSAHLPKMQEIRARIQKEGHLTFIAEHKRKDASLIPVEVNTRHFILNQKPIVLASARDITDRRRLKEENRVRQQQLDNLLQNVPAGIFRTTIALPAQRVMANPVLAQIFGYDSVEEFMASPLDESYVDSKDRQDIVERLLREGVVSNAEIRMKKKDGEHIWVSMSAVAVPGPDGAMQYLDGVLTDITAKKKTEEALIEANRKLKLLNSVTRHDITNQLLALNGFLQVASSRTTDPVMVDYLAKFQRIAETISSHIEFTRAYQELGINVPAWLQVADVIRKTPGSHPVSCDGSCQKIEIFSDPMLERVFFNLFENSVRHGEHVTGIVVRCEPAGENLRIIIEDDGVGIPQSDKAKIFNRGFGKNTGLGLFLVREILTITGITIEETGTPGNGARFEMLVPKGAFRYGG